jgi:hypothetical protein
MYKVSKNELFGSFGLLIEHDIMPKCGFYDYDIL